jgi:hypothetical protein
MVLHSWFAGKHVGPANAVLPGGAFLFCAAKAVKMGRDPNLHKTEITQE